MQTSLIIKSGQPKLKLDIPFDYTYWCLPVSGVAINQWDTVEEVEYTV